MALNKRERNLVILVGALGFLVVAWFVFGAIVDPLGELGNELTNESNRLTAKQRDMNALNAAKAKLKDYRERSLPSNAGLARSAYLAWLWQLAQEQAKFKKPTIDRVQETAAREAYTKLSFTVHGQGSLDQLVKFLHGFYSAGHLHLIRNLSIKPSQKGDDLELTITVEALIVNGVDRKDTLTTVDAKRLAAAGLDAYKPVADRNFFAPYKPPKVVDTVPPPKPDPFDPSKYAYFTGIVEVDGARQAFLKSRISDDLMRLPQGASFNVGPLKGQIARIGLREVEIEVDGKRHTIALGDHLPSGEASAKPDGAKGPETKPEPGPKPEAKPEGKPEPKAEAKPEIKPEGAPDGRFPRKRESRRPRGEQEPKANY